MKYYQVVAESGVALAGSFHLTDAQIAARLHLFGGKSKDNRATAKTPAFFKLGEVIGFDGEIPKGNTGLEPWQGNFDDRIKGERQATAAARDKALAARTPPPRKAGAQAAARA